VLLHGFAKLFAALGRQMQGGGLGHAFDHRAAGAAVGITVLGVGPALSRALALLGLGPLLGIATLLRLARLTLLLLLLLLTRGRPLAATLALLGFFEDAEEGED